MLFICTLLLCSGPMDAALGYFEDVLGLVCPPRKDAGSFLQVRCLLLGGFGVCRMRKLVLTFKCSSRRQM